MTNDDKIQAIAARLEAKRARLIFASIPNLLLNTEEHTAYSFASPAADGAYDAVSDKEREIRAAAGTAEEAQRKAELQPLLETLATAQQDFNDAHDNFSESLGLYKDLASSVPSFVQDYITERDVQELEGLEAKISALSERHAYLKAQRSGIENAYKDQIKDLESRMSKAPDNEFYLVQLSKDAADLNNEKDSATGKFDSEMAVIDSELVIVESAYKSRMAGVLKAESDYVRLLEDLTPLRDKLGLLNLRMTAEQAESLGQHMRQHRAELTPAPDTQQQDGSPNQQPRVNPRNMLPGVYDRIRQFYDRHSASIKLAAAVLAVGGIATLAVYAARPRERELSEAQLRQIAEMVTPVPGPQGAQGSRGYVGPVGSVGPQGPAGNPGNVYQLTPRDIERIAIEAAGHVTPVAGLQGPQGVAGAQGPVGPQGAAGKTPDLGDYVTRAQADAIAKEAVDDYIAEHGLPSRTPVATATLVPETRYILSYGDAEVMYAADRAGFSEAIGLAQSTLDKLFDKDQALELVSIVGDATSPVVTVNLVRAGSEDHVTRQTGEGFRTYVAAHGGPSEN